MLWSIILSMIQTVDYSDTEQLHFKIWHTQCLIMTSFEKQCEDIKATLVRLGKEPPEPVQNHSDPSHSTPNTNTGHTHPHNMSDPAHSSLHSEPVRRSLRRLGVKPDTPGLPYYAPTKPCTPRKDSTTSQQIEQEESMIMEDVEEEEEIVKSDQRHINELSCSPRSVHVVTSTEEPKVTPPPSPPPLSHSAVDSDVVVSKEGKNMTVRRLEFTPPLPQNEEEHEMAVDQADSRLAEGVTDAHTDTQVAAGNENAIDKSASMETLVVSDEIADKREVILDKQRMVRLFEQAVEMSEEWSIERMVRLHSTLEQLAFRHRMSWDRAGLLEDYQTALKYC